MGKCYSLPGLKKVGYVPVSMLPSDIIFMSLAGGIVPLYDSVTYFDVAPGAVCEVEEEFVNAYAAKGKAVVEVGKHLEGRNLKIGEEAEFTFTLGSTSRLDKLFMNMHVSLQSDNIYGNLKSSAILYNFMIELDNAMNHLTSSSGTNPALKKCLEFIDTDYAGQITMDDLCDISHMSKQHICRLFRSCLGTRPMEYIAKRRIQAAKELLSGTELTVEDIADRTGFCTSSYFCKLFCHYMLTIPSSSHFNYYWYSRIINCSFYYLINQF